jgi:superfamily II DNA or RNA helicase
MGLWNWFIRRFRRIQVQPLSISFTADMGADGHHTVRVFRRRDNELEPIRNVGALLRYDYREVAPDGGIVYTIAPDDRQVLLSLQSLNPIPTADGALRFEVTPPILRHLRQKSTVHELPSSQALRIADQPLRPIAKIHFDARHGIQVEAGYDGDGAGALTPADQVHKIGDGAFVRIGNLLAPLAAQLNQTAQTFLNRVVTHVAPEQIPEFFTRDLVLLKHDCNAVLTDMAKQIRVIEPTNAPVVSVHKTPGGWLDFKVEYEAGEELWAQSTLMNAGGARYRRVNDTTWLKPDEKLLARVQQQLDDLGANLVGNRYRVPVSQFASLEEFIRAIGGVPKLSAAYVEFLEQLTGFQADPGFTLAPAIEEQLKSRRITLRPYQREGIHWLTWLNENRLHGLLADDMGLGKTMQVICAIGQAYQGGGNQHHSLIIAPKSVLVHWERELQRCLPNVLPCIYHGAQRHHLRRLFADSHPILFISTYSTVANDIDELAQIPFLYVVLDEATYIKNPAAKRTQGIKALNAVHRCAVSGTPVENRPAELWSLFDFLMRGHLGRHGTFQHRFENPILNGDKPAADALGRRIRPFLLRRIKEEVAKDLPEKIEMTEWCELSEEQRNLYGTLQASASAIRNALARGEQVDYTSHILPVITKLKQICDHPAIVTGRSAPIEGRSQKFDWIIEKVGEILGQGEQVVIFSHFLGMLNLLQQAVNRLSMPYIRIDGSTNNRHLLMDRFNRGEARVALCSLQAAGHGITLTGANHVIHADRWWNPAIEDQATDRVHRIGQDKTVYVYRILTEGTLEERIDQLLEQKRVMAGQIMSAAGAQRLQWTREELIDILKPLQDAPAY